MAAVVDVASEGLCRVPPRASAVRADVAVVSIPRPGEA